LPGASLRPWSFYLCLLCSWDNKHITPGSTCFLR
jgi:hypothetical protein